MSELLADRPLAEREGLPRTYQMRADAHYVDQLEGRGAPPAIRLISTRQFEEPAGSSSNLSPRLVQSVTAHGILQPLLVRRQSGRYQIIAGHRRLAAAIAAGLADVPCFTYDIDDAEASALAEADNLRASAPYAAPSVDTHWRDVLQAVSRNLEEIDSAAAQLRRSGGEALSRRVAADVIAAQTWRAGWLSRSALIAGDQEYNSTPKTVGSILDRLKAGFEAQSRLTRLQLEYAAAPSAANFGLDEDLGMAAIAGCVFATAAWLEDCDEARAEIRADAPNPRTLRVEVVQRLAQVPDEALRYLREPGLGSRRDLMPALGLLTAQTVAARQGGTVELTAIRSKGSVIRLTFCRADTN